MNIFASEMQLNELKYIIFEKRNYVLGKTKDLLLVFSEKPVSSDITAIPMNLEKIVSNAVHF